MKLAWGNKVSPQFRAQVAALCKRVGIADPSWLMACMAFETGHTFDPAKRNPSSGATGLIQFMPSTATLLGTTVELLAAMSAEQQLVWVEKYFSEQRGPFLSLADCYMAILWPRAIGAADDAVIFNNTDAAYAGNKGLDLNKDGYLTKREATSYVQRALDDGLQEGNAAELLVAATVAPPLARTTEKLKMGILEIISIFGPILSKLIPQVATIFKPESMSSARDAATASKVIDVITETAGAANVMEAVEKMQADPALTEQVQKAVVNDPTIMQILEIGSGGIAGARAAAALPLPSPAHWWDFLVNPMMWVTLGLFGLVYLAMMSMVGWLPDGYREWDAQTRSNVLFLIVGNAIGAIVGYWTGTTMNSTKKDQVIAQQSATITKER